HVSAGLQEVGRNARVIDGADQVEARVFAVGDGGGVQAIHQDEVQGAQVHGVRRAVVQLDVLEVVRARVVVVDLVDHQARGRRPVAGEVRVVGGGADRHAAQAGHPGGGHRVAGGLDLRRGAQ